MVNAPENFKIKLLISLLYVDEVTILFTF
jgi:hypothetical protein